MSFSGVYLTDLEVGGSHWSPCSFIPEAQQSSTGLADLPPLKGY